MSENINVVPLRQPWVIGLAMLRGEGPCIRRWSRW